MRFWQLFFVMLAFMFVQQTDAQSTVVGDGTPASCTFSALETAVLGGGTITFDCGGAVTIPINQTLDVQALDLTLDGGNNVTLQGVAGQRMLDFRTWGFDAARTLRLQNIIIADANITGAGTDANGAAIRVRNQSAEFPADFPTVYVDNMTFTNNRSFQTSTSGNPYDYGGGAIFILGGILHVTNSTFENNLASQGAGGAIHGLGATIHISDSTFVGNDATPVSSSSNNSGFAGAIYVDGTLAPSGGSIQISNSIFENNRGANSGGAAYINLYNSRGSFLTIDGSHFEGNTISGGASGLGGAISGGGTGGSVDVTITNSSFVDNSVADASGGASGGAVAFAQATNLTVTNTTFSGNRAEGVCSNCYNANGGGLYASSNTNFEINNSTFANNYAGWVGGAITGSDGVLRNTIFLNNTADNGGNGWMIQQHCSSELTNDGGNFQYPDRNPNLNFFNEVVCANNITIADAMLDSLSEADNGTQFYPLRITSPVIDAGVNSNIPNGISTDQIGNPRIRGAQVDSGAYESNPLLLLDMNGDDLITPEDAVYIVNRIGDTVTDSTIANVDGDGDVDNDDVAAVSNELGQVVTP